MPRTRTMNAESLEHRLEAQAYALGFDLVGIATLGPADTAQAFSRWIDAGYHGDMQYMQRGSTKRRDSRLAVDGARTAVMVALNYGGTEAPGPIARYARGSDYHHVMRDKLSQLHRWLDAEHGSPIHGKAYVDTGPILERDLARRAGLGWFGKNTNLLHPRLGSFFFLGALLLDLDLEPSAPFDVDRCGMCTRCLQACPTGALVAPGVLDARICISYLTIELRGAIPLELREAIGGLLYGCDICQEVCPWNISFSRELQEPAFAPREALGNKDTRTLARELLAMSQAEFSVAFKGSPMKRAKLRGLKRNAAVVLGNVGDERDVDVLTEALNDPEPLVREHAAWALERIRSG
jgi:epoxyqueuosine reductase